MANIGYFPGSFDPITYGHLDIIARALKLVDRLVIGIGTHHGKSGFLTPKERTDLIQAETQVLAKDTGCEISIETFDNLVVEAAKAVGANLIIRGLRDGRDFEYERQMAMMNAAMMPGIETVFLAASPETSFIASSLVKQIATMKGDISKFVPPNVAQAIAQHVANE